VAPTVNCTPLPPDFSHRSLLRPCLPGQQNLRSLAFKRGAMSQILSKIPVELHSNLPASGLKKGIPLFGREVVCRFTQVSFQKWFYSLIQGVGKPLIKSIPLQNSGCCPAPGASGRSSSCDLTCPLLSVRTPRDPSLEAQTRNSPSFLLH